MTMHIQKSSNTSSQTLDLKFGEWTHKLHAGILAARRGREVLLKYMGRLQEVESKFQAGLVSEADKESEKVIFDVLRQNFPEDEFLGEESSYQSTKVQEKSSKRGRWIVDPLDGTTNYIHQFPIFCVSIGYEYDGEIQIAIVDVPILGEVYTAVKGHGAYVNGKRLNVSQTDKLQNAFLATGFFNEVESRLSEQLKIFNKIVRESRAIRRVGTAAYDLCLVARGIFDGYWEKGLQPWDSAAGLLLVTEAGGVVTTYRGEKYSPFNNSLISGNPLIAKLLQESMRDLISEDSD